MTSQDSLKLVDPSDVVVIILGGGRGTRLYPLTRDRAKPAVGFGGKYRLIDITLTNCLRSGFNKIFILTQFNSFSLNRHIWQTYSRETQSNSYIDVIAAEQTAESGDWFQGTADAVRQSLRHTLTHHTRYALILSADQIYSMDYRSLLLWHQNERADVTIAAKFMTDDEITGLGVVGVDSDLRVVGFREKPETVAEVEDFRLSKIGSSKIASDKPFLASMGLYLFNAPTLVSALEGGEQDFGKAVIPRLAGELAMSCYPFDGYWEDVGTIEAFYQANMDWRAGVGIAGELGAGGSLITHARQLAPTRITGTRIEESVIADGGHIQAEAISRCIVGVRSRIGAGTVIEDSILMGNDEDHGGLPLAIGRNCRIRRAIIDKNAVIGDGSVIENAEGVTEADNALFSIRSGIIVIPRAAVLPPNTKI